jgi:hypothetical protein
VTIKIEHFATRSAKAEAEKRAVREEKPPWNILLQLPQLPLETLLFGAPALLACRTEPPLA